MKEELIEPLTYLERVSTAFIKPKFYDVIHKATIKLLETPGDESIIEDYLEIILIHDDSPKRLRIKSQKYYGNDWSN